jgi:hypothetical protein
MKLRTLFCAVFSVVLLGGAAQAADKAKDGTGELNLPSMQLGDYSVNLATDQPKFATPEPSGLSTMRQDDTPRAFLGLSLSRPLPENFWDFGR